MIHGDPPRLGACRAHDRRRLQLVALYGVLIAALDTVALVLVYALINLLDNQPVTGIVGSVVGGLDLSGPTTIGRR